MKLEEIRGIIEKEVVSFALEPTRRFFVLRTFTGSGKTTSSLQALDANGIRWIYAAPTHEIIDENVKCSSNRSYNFVHLKSREKCCLNNEYRELSKQGLDISFFCKSCGFKREGMCEYEVNVDKAYRNRPNLGITHSHLQSWLPKFLTSSTSGGSINGQYDVLIVDENPIKCFIHEETVTYQALSYLRECLLRFNRRDFIPTIDILLNPEIDYTRLKRIDLSHINIDRENKAFSHAISQAYLSGELANIPKNLLPFIHEIMMRKDMGYDIEKMIYTRDGFIYLSYFKPDALNLGIKIIALDGTANEQVWQHMLNSTNVEMFYIDYQYENAYQLNGGRYPISSWRRGNDTAINLCKLMDKIAEKKKRNVLVVGTSFVIQKANSLMQTKNHMFANYYNLRSRNSYWKKCDTVILACEPNPPQEKIDACVSLSGWDERIWRLIYREEEMLQAIGRLRQNILLTPDGDPREKMEVYILPSTGVANNYSALLNEAHVLSKSNLITMLDSSGFYEEHLLFESQILTLCPTNPNQIRLVLGCGYQRTKRYFAYLEKEGLIQQIKGGLYDITEKGKTRLPPNVKETKGATRNPIYTK